jgi:hypothetical protein
VSALARSVAPHVIVATAVYSVDEARLALRLKKTTIRREVREKRLRVAKRAGQYYLLGEWLLEWIRAGERLAAKGQSQASTNGRPDPTQIVTN